VPAALPHHAAHPHHRSSRRPPSAVACEAARVTAYRHEPELTGPMLQPGEGSSRSTKELRSSIVPLQHQASGGAAASPSSSSSSSSRVATAPTQQGREQGEDEQPQLVAVPWGEDGGWEQPEQQEQQQQPQQQQQHERKNKLQHQHQHLEDASTSDAIFRHHQQPGFVRPVLEPALDALTHPQPPLSPSTNGAHSPSGLVSNGAPHLHHSPAAVMVGPLPLQPSLPSPAAIADAARNRHTWELCRVLDALEGRTSSSSRRRARGLSAMGSSSSNGNSWSRSAAGSQGPVASVQEQQEQQPLQELRPPGCAASSAATAAAARDPPAPQQQLLHAIQHAPSTGVLQELMHRHAHQLEVRGTPSVLVLIEGLGV